VPWFQFKHLGRGMQSAQVRARLEAGNGTSRSIDFLVDSGASLSLIPSASVQNVMPPDFSGEEVDLGLQDVSGKPVRGKLIEFRVHLVDASGFMVTTERFGVGNVKWPVLGLTWFKKVGVHFRNFDHRWQGARFALYDPSIAPT